MPETPEQRARREIDADLTAAGWIVQSRDELDITAGRGVAVREFQMQAGFGFADYLLYLDRKAVGAVEAKPEGTLSGEQEEWLDRIAERIATSLAKEPQDFDTGWFGQHGSLGHAHVLFGGQLGPFLAELNEKLAA